jgi:osmoprotectant transport system permease protein
VDPGGGDVVNLLGQLLDFLGEPAHWSGSRGIPTRLVEHLWYTGVSLAIAALIAFPVGSLIGHTGKGAFLAINIGNAARSLPTLGLLTLVVLLVGIGITPVLVALVALGIPPILAATYAGIRGVEPATIDAARGMGMTEGQLLLRAELPIALPLILSGLRSAALQIVATATVAAYVALGGLGRFLIDGLGVRDYAEMLAGAFLVAALAILIDVVFAVLSRVVVSAGLTGRYAISGTTDVTIEAAEAVH